MQISHENPYADKANTRYGKPYQNRTVTQKNVPYGAFSRRINSMNLQDKHKEYAVKCYASFMQTSSIIDGFFQQFWDDLSKPEQEQPDQDPDEYQYKVDKHWQKVRENLRNQLRRYDINHQEFPQKYKELFNQTRKEYILNYIVEEMQGTDNIVQELEALYGYVRQCIFGMAPSDKTIKNVQLAQKLLDSIATHKKNKQ